MNLKELFDHIVQISKGTINNFLEKGIEFFISFILIFILFPISIWRIIIFILCIIFVFIAFHKSVKINNARRNKKVALVSMAAFSLLVVIAASATLPLFFFSKPIYIYFKDGVNPLKSKELKLIPELSNSGNILIVTDPIRRFFISFISKFSNDTIRIITLKEIDESRYLVLPFKKFEHIENSVIPNTGFRTIWTPAYLPLLHFGIERSEDPGGTGNIVNIEFSLGVKPIDFIKETQVYSSKILPWESVKVKKDVDENILRYAAILDSAIQLVTDGDIDKAINQLASALSHAPSKIEEARVLSLIGRIIT